MLAIHALLALGYVSKGLAALITPPGRLIRPNPIETRADLPGGGHVGNGLRSLHPSAHDTCFYANATTLSDMTFSVQPASGASTDFTDIDTCLCLSGLSATLEDLSSTAALVDEYGLPETEGAFSTYIAASPYAKECTYPPHSQPRCTRDNLCGFTCDPLFVAVGESCVCQDSSGCGQTSPPATCQAAGKTRRLSKRSTISTLAMAQSECEVDETVCGAFDGTTASFQCVDIQTSLDSCGGCMMPNPFGLRVNGRTTGVDCTAIPSVDVVSCMSGRCVVESCVSGWVVDAEGSGCIREQSIGGDEHNPRGIASQLYQNETESHSVRPHSNWRIADYRSVIDRADSVTPRDASPVQFTEDWTRIPDYRRRI